MGQLPSNFDDVNEPRLLAVSAHRMVQQVVDSRYQDPDQFPALNDCAWDLDWKKLISRIKKRDLLDVSLHAHGFQTDKTWNTLLHRAVGGLRQPEADWVWVGVEGEEGEENLYGRGGGKNKGGNGGNKSAAAKQLDHGSDGEQQEVRDNANASPSSSPAKQRDAHFYETHELRPVPNNNEMVLWIVRSILRHRANVNVMNLKNETPLITSLRNGHGCDLVCTLLDYKAHCQYKARPSISSATALEEAMERAKTAGGPPGIAPAMFADGAQNPSDPQTSPKVDLSSKITVEELLKSNADPSNFDDNVFVSAVTTAVKFEAHPDVVLNLLLQKKVDVNVSDGDDMRRRTALHYLVRQRNLAMVAVFLQSKKTETIDCNIPDVLGQTAVYECIDLRHVEMLQLLSDSGTQIRTYKELGPGIWKNVIGWPKDVKRPTLKDPRTGRRLLRDPTLVRVDMFDKQGVSPLMFAILKRWPEGVKCLLQNYPTISFQCGLPLKLMKELPDVAVRLKDAPSTGGEVSSNAAQLQIVHHLRLIGSELFANDAVVSGGNTSITSDKQLSALITLQEEFEKEKAFEQKLANVNDAKALEKRRKKRMKAKTGVEWEGDEQQMQQFLEEESAFEHPVAYYLRTYYNDPGSDENSIVFAARQRDGKLLEALVPYASGDQLSAGLAVPNLNLECARILTDANADVNGDFADHDRVAADYLESVSGVGLRGGFLRGFGPHEVFDRRSCGIFAATLGESVTSTTANVNFANASEEADARWDGAIAADALKNSGTMQKVDFESNIHNSYSVAAREREAAMGKGQERQKSVDDLMNELVVVGNVSGEGEKGEKQKKPHGPIRGLVEPFSESVFLHEQDAHLHQRRSPAMVACTTGKANLIRLLQEYGADVKKQMETTTCWSTHVYAARANHLEKIKLADLRDG